jgi:hypothetical protein
MREAMRGKGMVALARVVLAKRERSSCSKEIGRHCGRPPPQTIFTHSGRPICRNASPIGCQISIRPVCARADANDRRRLNSDSNWVSAVPLTLSATYFESVNSKLDRRLHRRPRGEGRPDPTVQKVLTPGSPFRLASAAGRIATRFDYSAARHLD